jgi:hypothetical protein
MTDTDEEELAILLHKIYSEAISKSLWGWDDLQPYEKTGWLMVAQWVAAFMDNEEIPDHK